MYFILRLKIQFSESLTETGHMVSLVSKAKSHSKSGCDMAVKTVVSWNEILLTIFPSKTRKAHIHNAFPFRNLQRNAYDTCCIFLVLLIR